ncbi:hypothetical protein IFR05_017060 [Cadophora sp. M221]|nr:hypothetical protein IFR05_017060 [Cadophora sp. M221]
MASEQAGVSAPFNTTLSEPVTTSNPDPARSKSLKRGRSDQVAPSLISIAHAGLGGSPSPKSPRFKGTFSPGFAPIPLTGEAALVDERRRFEENQRRQQPAMSNHKALLSLMAGGGAGMSKPQDAPVATTTLSEGLSMAAAPRSPSQKKHKCPYCEKEFTRNHIFKSHLSTHSQEKSYVCQTCQMRFRRLHDLKRHMKLHTGERPHICPKCDRKFARGDALARHSKGKGGCAGRRASMGSFGGEDDYEGSNAGDGDDSMMDGVLCQRDTAPQ